MRLKANVMGYSLNQRGLFGNVIRDPRDRRVKLNDGKHKEKVKASHSCRIF